MKKTILALVLGALAASTANANWYAEGDIGISKTKFSAHSALDKTKIEPRVAVGYKLGNLRVAGDYTHHGSFSGNAANEHVNAKVRGLGVSAIYDIDVNSKVKPYVGARVAANQFKLSNRNNTAFKETDTTKVGYGVVAGAKYRLDQKWYVNGGVEYNRLGSFDDTKVNNYGAKAGIGYDF